MNYKIEIVDSEDCIIIQEHNGDEETKEVSLFHFFQAAQNLGFFPEGKHFDSDCCIVQFDFYGVERSVTRGYKSMLEANCFGTEDLGEIISSFFEKFPKEIWIVSFSDLSVTKWTRQNKKESDRWRLYANNDGVTRTISLSWIGTEWSEFRTNRKEADEMLLNYLQTQIVALKKRMEAAI